MWDRKIEECVGEFLVTISFKNVEDQFSWAFPGVYGPNAEKFDGLVFCYKSRSEGLSFAKLETTLMIHLAQS
jgi:hypothetical protein